MDQQTKELLIKTLAAEKAKIETAIAELRGKKLKINTGFGVVEMKVRKPMSAAARAKISAAQKKRWSKRK